jgi:hypothetical protein
VEIQKGCAVWLKKMILFCLFPQFKAAASFIITELFEEFHSSASQYHIMSPVLPGFLPKISDTFSLSKMPNDSKND